MNELDKFNEQHHGKSEAEREQIIYGGDWRPQDIRDIKNTCNSSAECDDCRSEDLAITRPEPHVDPAFQSQAPFPLDPAAFFATTEAALEFVPIGAEINFDEIKNGFVVED